MPCGHVEYVKIRPEDQFLLESYTPIVVYCAGSFYYNSIKGARDYAHQLLGDPGKDTHKIFECALKLMEGREGTKTKRQIVENALSRLNQKKASG